MLMGVAACMACMWIQKLSNLLKKVQAQAASGYAPVMALNTVESALFNTMPICVLAGCATFFRRRCNEKHRGRLQLDLCSNSS